MKKATSLFKLMLAAGTLSVLAACSGSNGTAVSETGTLGWPEITAQNKPWSRWWWPASAVGKADIDSMLVKYSEAGLGGLEVTTIYGAKGYEDKYLEYLSPEWMDLFTYTLDEAGKLGLGIDLANASGWPFGGPWVTPDYACRYLATRTWQLKGGEKFADKIEYVEKAMVRSLGKKADISSLEYPIAANDSLQQYAFEQVRYPQPLPVIAVAAYGQDGRYEDLTAKVAEDGSLDWTAPEGDWTICAMFLGWHGKLVERAGPGGEGDVIDHFSGDAITRYLAKFDEAFKGYDVSGIRYYFNDSYEVDDAVGDSDWTENFFEEFSSRRGYDLKPHMLDLLGKGNDSDVASRVLFDYRTTIGELLLEKYSVMWQEWAAKQGKGIRNQAHGSPANILDLYSVSDVPETEGRSIIGMKTASSAAHVCDKPLTSSESATWLNEHFRSDLGDVKTAVDTYLLSGVNHIFYHGTCMSPNDAPWPGWLFYAAVHFHPSNSFWTDFAAFNKYVARCQSVLQAGKPDNDILLFFDATDLLSQPARGSLLYHMNQNTPAMSAIGESASYLYDKGYTWDYITDMMLSEKVDVKDGKIVTGKGSSYSTIIIPECGLMLADTFGTLVDLARKGATVMVENALPEDVPGLSGLEKNRSRLAELKASLKFTEENGISIAKCGKGRFMMSEDLDAMLKAAGISRETMYDKGLQCISRIKDDGGKYYFVKNPGSETVEGWIPVDAVCGSIAVYNPMTGEFGYGKTREAEGGKREVFMRLLPDESLLLETFAGNYSGEEYSFYTEAGEAVPVDGTWSVRFTKGGPELPEAKEVKKLGSWTAYGKDAAIFCGTAEYSIDLPATKDSAAVWQLDLGDVRESASVWFDGAYVGTVFKKPFAVMLTQAQVRDGGKLTVKVSNSMENRIAYMDKNNIPWRIFYNANIQARLPEDRGKDGYFTAAGWETVDSGLLGPVTITPMKTISE